MKRTLPFLLLLATFAGCLGPSNAPDEEGPGPPTEGLEPGTHPSLGNEPGPDNVVPGAPTDLLWGGQVLEAIDCRQTYHNAFADRAAVDARVPAHLTVPGNGPVALVILLVECRSMTVGNESLQNDAWMYMTYVTLEREEASSPGEVAYLLEFGSDWSQAWMPLVPRGIPSVGGAFNHSETMDADTLTFTSDGVAYTFADLGSNPSDLQAPPSRRLLLAGPEAETVIDFTMNFSRLGRLPTGGTLQLGGGVLEDLYGPAAPSISTEGEGGATLKEVQMDSLT